MCWFKLKLKSLFVCVVILSFMNMASGADILPTQGFDSSETPSGWTEYNGGDAVNNWVHDVNDGVGGGGCPTHPYDVDYDDDWLISPAVDLSGYTNQKFNYSEKELDYQFAADQYVKLSTNFSGSGDPNLASWTTIYTANTFAAEQVYEDRSIDISAYSGQTVYIAFHYDATYGAQWFIDDVSVTGDVASSANVTFTNGANAAISYVQSGPSRPESNWPLGKFTLAGDATGATLSSITVTLGGTYDSNDFGTNPFRVFASSSDDISGASALGSDVAYAASGNDITFSGLSDAIPNGTRYYWVTADVASGASSAHSIHGTVSDASDLSITGGTVSGSSSYGLLNTGSDASLPVTLSLFSARQEGTSVILEWKTESEIDHLGFILERLEPDGEWVCIANYLSDPSLAGEGSSSTGREYTIEDEEVAEGIQVYRLIEVSIDGSQEEVGRIQINVDGAPDVTELKPAAPNPFNPATQIFYELSEESAVCIQIYDVMGRHVKTLLSGMNQKPGSYNIYWNGDNDNGLSVSTGTYIVTLDAGEYRKMRKVMLIR